MTKHIQKWKIQDLKPHPRQAQLFDDLPMRQLIDLAQDIEARGLKEPLEILPDGTLVCGHQRTRAAKYLQWEEIDVWVNHELAAQGAVAVEQRLIEDNLVGRKLDRLDQIRCYKRLVELTPQTPAHRVRNHQTGRLRDVIGVRLGISGRTLDRYLRVLDTPREVQDAFREGRVSLVNASRVAGLSQEAQQQLVDDLRAGTDPKQAIAARLAGRVPDTLEAVLGAFVRSLERNVPALEPHASQIHSLSAYDTHILERAHALIRQIMEQVQATDDSTKGDDQAEEAS
jgi:hypothetical protein